MNKRARPLSSLIMSSSSSKQNKQNDDEETDSEEGAADDQNGLVLSENIMFAYAENQVQAHKDFMKFAKIETQNTNTLNENICILIQTQEKVIKKIGIQLLYL